MLNLILWGKFMPVIITSLLPTSDIDFFPTTPPTPTPPNHNFGKNYDFNRFHKIFIRTLKRIISTSIHKLK